METSSTTLCLTLHSRLAVPNLTANARLGFLEGTDCVYHAYSVMVPKSTFSISSACPGARVISASRNVASLK